MRKRFLRKSRDKVFGGVCSGLADYVEVDVTLVRIITLFGILASGIFPGLLLYLICLIIVPLDTSVGGHYNPGNPGQENFDGFGYNNYEGSSYPTSNNTRYIIGGGLILVGLFIIFRMFFAWIDWRYVFAGLLILIGLFILFGGLVRRGDR